MNVITQVEEEILTIRLNKPDRLNALDAGMLAELTRAVEEEGANCRAIIITGEGRGFCSGADLAAMDSREGDALLRNFVNPAILALASAKVPTVAAVNGVVAGAGLGLALVADIRIGSDLAGFVPAFAALGLVPDAGVTFLARLRVGPGPALRFLLSEHRTDAERALRMGFLDEVLPSSQLDEAARSVARQFKFGDAVAASETVRLVRGREFVEGLTHQLEAEAFTQEKMVERQSGKMVRRDEA